MIYLVLLVNIAYALFRSHVEIHKKEYERGEISEEESKKKDLFNQFKE